MIDRIFNLHTGFIMKQMKYLLACCYALAFSTAPSLYSGQGELLQGQQRPVDQVRPSSPDEVATQAIYVEDTSHYGALHKFIGVTLLGDQLKLEDDSFWIVYSDHRYILLNWYPYDDVVIVPASWWSKNINNMDFTLCNIRTGQSVDVKLYLNPSEYGYYTRKIREIVPLYDNPYLILDDGSFWPLNNSDRAIWGENKYGQLMWQPGDLIIIGMNDGFITSWFYPNILINASCSCTWTATKCQN